MHAQGTHVISTDEMTGIQALERVILPMEMRHPQKIDHEYVRHGTVTLIANWEVATGKVISPSLGATRTEADFANHIATTVAIAPTDSWIFISDNLNTHQSATLVEWVAEVCKLADPLGVKGKSGILGTQPSRALFLADKSHRIYFVYTPKHCSWLNQVECWFSILARRLLRRSSFLSVDHLRQKIIAFISYFNELLSKPFKWKFRG
ncbi:MAG: transposase [Pseudanabaena sp. CAN_BIN31]|nr:transposase [Pseudanabaena sp. CAN_BIN31]